MTSQPVLFFDGHCNLCNGAVQFVIRHDREGRVRFAPLQSAAGEAAKAALLKEIGRVPDSLILLDDGVYYTESDAALRLAAYLDGGWKGLRHLQAVPRAVRNAVYRLVARYRYKVFGRRASCMIPSADLRRRFLDV